MINKAKTIALAVLLAALLNGCAANEVAEAESNSRYRSEYVENTSLYTCVHVITDTETGQRWMVCTNNEGGIAVEPMDERGQE